MKKMVCLLWLACSATGAFAQLYNRERVCGTDTQTVSYRNQRGEFINFRGFKCTQVAKLGIRVDLGYNGYVFNSRTRQWLGNPNGALIGLSLLHGRWAYGLRFKPASARLKMPLVAGGDTLGLRDTLNPGRIDLYLGYSFDFAGNLSLEPYIGLTRNLFYLKTEQGSGKTYRMPRVYGLNAGLTLNKYFSLKQFRFLGVLLSYGYGFSNFRKVNPGMGTGYSEWIVGLVYKGFARRNFYEKLN